jgi:hypothetical protein
VDNAERKLKCYQVMAVSTLLHGSETLRMKNISKIQQAEIKLLVISRDMIN